MTKTFNHVVFM